MKVLNMLDGKEYQSQNYSRTGGDSEEIVILPSRQHLFNIAKVGRLEFVILMDV